MVSEMEREKSRHIRGQICSMIARSLAQLYYIYDITNTCLPYYSERRSRKSWELVTPSSQQSSDVALAIKKFGLRKNVYALINPFFNFFLN